MDEISEEKPVREMVKKGKIERWPAATRMECERLFCQERMRLPDICARTGVPVGTLNIWRAHDLWIAKRDRSMRQTNKLGQSISSANGPDKADMTLNLEALADFAKATFGHKRVGWRDAMADKAIILPLLLDVMAPMDILRQADKLEKLDHLFRRALDLDTPENPVFVHLSFLSAPVEDAPKLADAIEILPALPPIPSDVRDSNPHVGQEPNAGPEQS
jgi:hypothetical protein